MKKIIDCLKQNECGYKIECKVGFNAFDRVMRVAAKKKMAHKGLDKVLESLYFEIFRFIDDDLLDEERFYYVDDIDFDGIVTYPDGSQGLPMNLYMWDNRRYVRFHNREHAIIVPFTMRFVSGKKHGWDWSKTIHKVILQAEEIREARGKKLRYEKIDENTTLVTAPDNSKISVNTLVANDLKTLVEKFGIDIYSIDIDMMKGEISTLNILNFHIDNPEILENKAFQIDFRELYKKAGKYNWDVYFIRPGHSRNAIIETMFSK